MTLQSPTASIDSAQKSTASDSALRFGLGAAGAQRLVDRDAVEAGLLAAGHLAEQLLVLALLDVAVEVGHAAALLGAAVDGEQAPVGELQPLALAAALERVHETPTACTAGG